MKCVAVVLSVLFLAEAAGALRAESENIKGKNKTALIADAKPHMINKRPQEMINKRPGARATKPVLSRAARALAHQQKVQRRHQMIENLVNALHNTPAQYVPLPPESGPTQAPEVHLTANASCAEMVQGTIASLEYGYPDYFVSQFLESACDSYKLYMNMGGPDKCKVIFDNLNHEYRYDRRWAKWCADSAYILAAGPAAAPGPAYMTAAPAGPAAAPGSWHYPWLAATGLDGPSPEFFTVCGDIVNTLISRTSRGNPKGEPEKMDEYLTIICSVPRTPADENLCEDFKKTFLEHIHPNDHHWNANTMDTRLFCNGFYKVLVQHVGFFHAMAVAGPPGPAPSPAPGAPAGVPVISGTNTQPMAPPPAPPAAR